MAPAARVVVVGGGIAGLTAAYRLQQIGRATGAEIQVLLLEGSDRLGGKIRTERAGELVIEAGPDSFLSRKPAGIGLAAELGLTSRMIGTQPSGEGTFILRGDHLEPLPEGITMLVPTKLRPLLRSGLLSTRGKLGMALDLIIPPRPGNDDETVGAFIRRRFGDEAFERMAQPLLSGIFAGDADQLSLLATHPQLRDIERRYGSLIRGMLVERKRPPAPLPPGAPDAPFVSFTDGMAELIEALVVALDRVDIRFESPVATLQLTGDGYDVRLMSGEELATDAVILATPAFVTADLVTPLDGEMATLLRQIPYASSATITMAFRRQDVERQGGGRGFVVPHVEDREITAVTWVTSKFAHRAPDDIVLLRAFVGRAGRDWAIELNDDALLQIVRAELERMTGLYAEPLTTSIFRWRRAMPQYVVGHLTRLARIDERLLALPNLYLAGAAYRGVGIPDCIESGNNAALAVAAGLGLLARARPAAAGH